MGKTVPSYRMAVELEIYQWSNFRKSLSSDTERQAFGDIMDIAISIAATAGNACKPILFEHMMMSIILGQQKEIIHFNGKLMRCW